MSDTLPPEEPVKIGLGYRQDAHDPNDYPTERLLGAPPATPPALPVSLRRFRKGLLYQGGAGSCVAHALDRANDICLRYQFEQQGKAVEPPKSSRRFRYYNARRQEAVDAIARGEAAPTMSDAGCYPRLAMRAEQKIGFCEERLFPYTDDPEKINEVPPPECFHSAYDQKNFKYARNSYSGNARVLEVARGMHAGKPSIFGMFVDTAFMRNKGELINVINTSDPNGGGHMLCVLEVTPDEVIFDNWWCPPGQPNAWGDQGVGRMSWGLFGSSIITDVYMIENVPTFSSDITENA